MADENNVAFIFTDEMKEKLKADYKKVTYYCQLGQNEVGGFVSAVGKFFDNFDSFFLHVMFFLAFLRISWGMILQADAEKAQEFLSASFSELMEKEEYFIISSGNGTFNLLILMIPAFLFGLGMMYLTKILIHKSFVPAFRPLQFVFGFFDIALGLLLIALLIHIVQTDGEADLVSIGGYLVKTMKSPLFIMAVLLLSIPVGIIKYRFWGSAEWGYQAKFYSVRSKSFFHDAAHNKVNKDLERLKAKYNLPFDIACAFQWMEKGEMKIKTNESYEILMKRRKEQEEAKARELAEKKAAEEKTLKEQKAAEEKAQHEQRIAAAKARVEKIGPSHAPTYFIDRCRGLYKIAFSGSDFDDLEAAYQLQITSPAETDYYLAARHDREAKERLLQRGQYYPELYSQYSIEDRMLVHKFGYQIKEDFPEQRRSQEWDIYQERQAQEDADRKRREEFMLDYECYDRYLRHLEQEEYYRNHPPIQ